MLNAWSVGVQHATTRDEKVTMVECVCSVHCRKLQVHFSAMLDSWKNDFSAPLFQIQPIELNLEIPVENGEQPVKNNKTSAVVPKSAAGKYPYFCQSIALDREKYVSSSL